MMNTSMMSAARRASKKSSVRRMKSGIEKNTLSPAARRRQKRKIRRAQRNIINR